MTQRLDAFQQSPQLFRKSIELNLLLKDGAIEQSLQELTSTRTAQINGCSFCLDMHTKQARLHGERELRLHHLAAWRDSPLFSERERAALAWTEVLTTLPAHGVPDALYEQVRTQFSEKEICELTFHVMSSNAWNRLNVAFRTTPGSMDKSLGLDKSGLA